jgi:beta-glucanase (GH16 family)
MHDLALAHRRTRRITLIVAAAMALAAALLYPIAGTAPALASPPPGSSSMLADFEGPAAPGGFFVFNGGSTVTTTPITVADTDALVRPNQAGDIGALEVDYDIFDFGGFGAAFEDPVDWSQTAGLSFWFYGTGSGLGYQAEISDNRTDPNTDTSERFDHTFIDATPGWQQIVIPWSAFTRATDFQPGGAPDDGFTLTEVWAWAVVLPNGVDTVYFDDVALEPIVVDDFESGLPTGTDANGIEVGFSTFNGAGDAVGISIGAPPAIPLSAGPTSAIQVDLDVTGFAGFIHRFENATVDAWVPQDWSQSEAFSFWLHGNNSSTAMFIDILENRNPGSTTDDAERWRVDIVDDFTGWKYFEIPFSEFSYFGVGNGAPNDGAFDRFDVHGWAFGTLGTGGAQTYYIDDVGLVGVAGLPELTVGFDASSFDIIEGATGDIVVSLNRPLADEDPDEVSVHYSVETVVAETGQDFLAVAPGTLTFTKGGPTDLSFPITTLDNDKYEPTERLILRLSNVTGAVAGTIQAAANIIDDDPFDPLLLDDFESFPYLWDTQGGVTLDSVPFGGAAVASAAPAAGEHVLAANVPLAVEIDVLGNACAMRRGVVPVHLLSTDTFDATTVDHTTVRFGGAEELHRTRGVAHRHAEDVDGDGDTDLVFHFDRREVELPCDGGPHPFHGATFDGQPITAGGSDARFGRDFPIGQDWSDIEKLTFWWYGQGTGDELTLEVLDNRASDPGPSGWETVWVDEFDEPAGTPPDPANWGYEIGDGIVNGIPGWGNSELQYYTDDPANAATDGNGNLVITAAEADGSLDCYYGTCEYTSARLVTTKRAEFAYGRIEARVLVPDGGPGLWPAFWSLGTDIDLVDWPQTGEIDIMEYVSRVPDEIFGTIHGPGYSGGNAYGDTFGFPGGVATDYHTFTIEWQPDLIEWYVDGNLYHTATPADVAPNEWVFNDPVYLLLNLAIGGNFGGPVDPGVTFPQEMKVDYVRVEQAPDTAERFQASFVDDFAGWQLVEVPLASLVRSDEQPDGAPDDGLTLNDVWGYGFAMPDTGSSVPDLFLDQVRIVEVPPPTELTVATTADSGPGSLREALGEIADGGTISIDPSLAGATMTLTGGPIVFERDVTIDGSAAPGFAIDGGGTDRVAIVNAGADVTMVDLTLSGGFGFQLAGCVLNNGGLMLDGVTVTNCLMTTPAGDFWQGGGGIYSGDGATLHLVDSTVAGNTAQWSGGGVYSFFNTTTTIERSTISGNVSNDVGGALRSLGNVTITNSTISGNESTGWYGGAVFITDGVADMVNVTIKDNVSPPGAPAGVFVGTFGPSSATLNLTNTIVEDSCFLAPFGAGPVAINSLGYNLFADGTCGVAGTDTIVASALLGPLADNGGATLTHALLAGSPAIDGVLGGVCPATDQRGVMRDALCDIGSFEFVP